MNLCKFAKTREKWLKFLKKIFKNWVVLWWIGTNFGKKNNIVEITWFFRVFLHEFLTKFYNFSSCGSTIGKKSRKFSQFCRGYSQKFFENWTFFFLICNRFLINLELNWNSKIATIFLFMLHKFKMKKFFIVFQNFLNFLNFFLFTRVKR